MEIEELVAMMLEDLGLPNLEKKEARELEVSLGFKINGINRSGPKVLLDARRSSRIPFGRFSRGRFLELYCLLFRSAHSIVQNP